MELFTAYVNRGSRRIQNLQGGSLPNTSQGIEVRSPVPGQEPERTKLSSGKPKAYQAIRLSLAGTILPNEHFHKCITAKCGHAARLRGLTESIGFMVPMRARFWDLGLPTGSGGNVAPLPDH